MTAKADPDINDTLRKEGEDAARQRHDEAWANKGDGRAKALGSRSNRSRRSSSRLSRIIA